jgi:L-lactate dehydrogenase complex protein LldG
MQTFKTSKARENILGRIRKALGSESTPMPFPDAEKEGTDGIYAASDLSMEEKFADAFIRLGGKFVYCGNEMELVEKLHILFDNKDWHQVSCADKRLLQLFETNGLSVSLADKKDALAEVCITRCETLVARTGSILLSSAQYMGRTAPVFYPVHIVVAYVNQMVDDIQDALALMKKRYGATLPSMINLNTGPSRTADIEKTLVVGVHGPGEVFCFFVNVFL